MDGTEFTQGDLSSGATSTGQEDALAWYQANSGSSTHLVGQKTTNVACILESDWPLLNSWDWLLCHNREIDILCIKTHSLSRCCYESEKQSDGNYSRCNSPTFLKHG